MVWSWGRGPGPGVWAWAETEGRGWSWGWKLRVGLGLELGAWIGVCLGQRHEPGGHGYGGWELGLWGFKLGLEQEALIRTRGRLEQGLGL